MTKTLKTLVGSCLLGMALSVQAAPSLDVGEVTSAALGTVNVPVTFEPGGDAIVGLQFDIDFTNSEVTPAEQGLDGTGMVPAGAGGHPVVFSKIQTSPNTIRVVLADFDNPLAGGAGNDHNLAAGTNIINIPFTLNLAGAVATDEYDLLISNIVYSDAAGVAVVGAASDSGTITVVDFTLCDSSLLAPAGINFADVTTTFNRLHTPIINNPVSNCSAIGNATLIDFADVTATFNLL